MVAQGTTLAGRYRLDARLGAGGMGEVWRGEDVVLGRTVAVKVLLPGHTDDPGFGERFRGEARAMAAINHPGVVEVYDYGVDQVPGVGAQAYLVMKFVDGEPLDRLLARLGRIPPEAAMDLIAQAASALQAVHDQGIVHRDVKPGNLLVRADGTLVLTDFGIARADNASRLTDAGMVLGTAAYCAPEQAEGAPVTPAVDIYALGVVAYECLAGHRPFDGDTPVAIALKHIREAPPPLPADVPPGVRRLVEIALSKDPARRFRNAEAMSLAAKQAVHGPYTGDTAAPPIPAHPRPVTPDPHPFSGPSTGAVVGQDMAAAHANGPPGHPAATGSPYEAPVDGYEGAGTHRAASGGGMDVHISGPETISRHGGDGPVTQAGRGRRAAASGRRRIGVVTAVVTAGVLLVGGVAVALADFGRADPPRTESVAKAEGDEGTGLATAEPSPTRTRRKRPSREPATRRAEVSRPAEPPTEEPTSAAAEPSHEPTPTPTPTPSRTPSRSPSPSPSPTPTPVKKLVPYVLGHSLEEATAMLAKFGFKAEVQVSGGGPPLPCYIVIQQDPGQGALHDVRKPVEIVLDPDQGCTTFSPTAAPPSGVEEKPES